MTMLRFGHHQCDLFCFQRHFDTAQFESHRLDGRYKLRPDAVPMVFDTVTEREPPLKRLKLSQGTNKQGGNVHCAMCSKIMLVLAGFLMMLACCETIKET